MSKRIEHGAVLCTETLGAKHPALVTKTNRIQEPCARDDKTLLGEDLEVA